MANKNKFYITTAIDYVNAKPHIGHAYEKILADALARWHRLIGEKVWFLTGTDENAQKNAQAAKEAGLPVKEFIDKNVSYFIELCKVLNISYDDFIRTTEERHIKISQKLFENTYKKGDIYKATYRGLYCVGCEAYKTEKELVEGKCPEHNQTPKELTEEAYFFKLSKYKDKIIKLIENGFILPKERANEILSRFKEEELKDLCVTRKGIEWGIDVPFDKEFKIYVWYDALINYISGAGKNQEYWPAQCHVIGKGINWFHSVIWPAILLSTGYELPKNLLVHGYLTINGQKMSKTLGNVIDPIELVKKYNADTLRYFLLREMPVQNDGDFSETALKERHNNELANKLGNLISRVSTLAEKFGIEKTENKLLEKLKLKDIEKYLENYEIDKALNEIFAFIDYCNEYVQKTQPWKSGDKKILYELVDSIKAIAILLWPFIPETSEKIAKHFGFKINYTGIKKPLAVKSIKKSDVLFGKI
ncbi:MAG: methionine--tRNA ligase [Nanoarchaeota archaeon]